MADKTISGFKGFDKDCAHQGQEPAANTNEERPLKALPIMRDFRDTGNALEKIHPNPNHWSRWRERADIDKPWGAL